MKEKAIVRAVKTKLCSKGSGPLALFLGLLVALTILPFEVWAAGPGHEPHWSDLTPFVINFVIYVTVLVLLLRKPIAKIWRERRQQTENSLSSSAQIRQQARELNEKAAARLLALAAEAKALEERIDQEAEREAAAILAQAGEQVQRIKQQAQLSVQAERTHALAVARAEMVTALMAQARHRLGQELTIDSDRPFRAAAIRGARPLVEQ